MIINDEPTVGLLFKRARALAPELARLDIDLLLAHVTAKNRTFLRAWPEHCLASEQVERFEQLLLRRADGEPLAYLLGYREFWSLSLVVSPATLIPRPETELLVATALARMPTEGVAALDLGCGSGAIALALASERPAWQLEGVDIDPACVRIAELNACRHGLSNVAFRESNWFASVTRRYHLIVANPPYIDPDFPGLDNGDLRFEPRSALVADEAGMGDIRRIAEAAADHLVAGGWLMARARRP